MSTPANLQPVLDPEDEVSDLLYVWQGRCQESPSRTDPKQDLILIKSAF